MLLANCTLNLKRLQLNQLSPLYAPIDNVKSQNWLERQFLKITFEEEVSCDIQEIRRLIDNDSSANSSDGTSSLLGEVA